jgi:N-acyl-L-homoserine lactone synthetase
MRSRLITQRSQVQILPPLLKTRRSEAVFAESRGRPLIIWRPLGRATRRHGPNYGADTMSEPSGGLDELVQRVLSSYPYRFTVATNELDQLIAFRIRAEVATEAGWPGTPYPDGVERDEYDAAALHVIGWDGAEPICTGRLVLPPSALPTEVECGLVVEPVGSVVDVGRMAVVPSRRDVEHKVFVALLCRLYLEMRARGYETACGMMAPRARRLMRLLGLDLEELGPDRVYWGEMRAPVRFGLIANAASISRRWE